MPGTDHTPELEDCTRLLLTFTPGTTHQNSVWQDRNILLPADILHEDLRPPIDDAVLDLVARHPNPRIKDLYISRE